MITDNPDDVCIGSPSSHTRHDLTAPPPTAPYQILPGDRIAGTEIKIVVTANKHFIGKTSVAVVIAQALKQHFPEVVVVVENQDGDLPGRLRDGTANHVRAETIKIFDCNNSGDRPPPEGFKHAKVTF